MNLITLMNPSAKSSLSVEICGSDFIPS